MPSRLEGEKTDAELCHIINRYWRERGVEANARPVTRTVLLSTDRMKGRRGDEPIDAPRYAASYETIRSDLTGHENPDIDWRATRERRLT